VRADPGSGGGDLLAKCGSATLALALGGEAGRVAPLSPLPAPAGLTSSLGRASSAARVHLAAYQPQAAEAEAGSRVAQRRAKRACP
jgi:hypothetical protein